MTTGNSLALVTASAYALATYEEAKLREVVEINLGGDALSEFDLKKFAVPSGGGVAFNVETPDGKADVAKEIVGIIVSHQSRRVYWEKGVEESAGSSPPDCESRDGVRGVGKVADQHGKPCAECPLAQFGSGRKDGKPTRGQACSQKRALYLVLPDEILPATLALPPTSLASFKGYLAGLISARKPITGVVTKITLTKAKNQGGTEYAEAKFEAVGALDDESGDKMRKFGTMFAAMFNKPTVRVTTSAPSQNAAPKVEAPGWASGGGGGFVGREPGDEAPKGSWTSGAKS